MKYALLIYPKPGSEEALGEDEYRSVSAEYLAFREDPRCLGGAHLQPIETATTVRYGGGENLITDGPYADTKEVLGGYFVFEASNLDEACARSSRSPWRQRTDRAGLPARVGPRHGVPGRFPR
jgi:hypothetical protein